MCNNFHGIIIYNYIFDIWKPAMNFPCGRQQSLRTGGGARISVAPRRSVEPALLKLENITSLDEM